MADLPKGIVIKINKGKTIVVGDRLGWDCQGAVCVVITRVR